MQLAINDTSQGSGSAHRVAIGTKRVVAETFSTASARAQMLRIAASYDDMARTLDDLAEHQRQIALA